MQGEFRQPAPRRPEQRDSRVVIVQRAAQPQDSQPDTGKADPAAVTCDVPVPASAFAPLIGSGDSGKSSADFTPFATTAVAVVKEDSGSDRETESETEDERPPVGLLALVKCKNTYGHALLLVPSEALSHSGMHTISRTTHWKACWRGSLTHSTG